MKKALYLFLLLVMITVSFWAGRRYTRTKAGGNVSARRVLYYVDPMHPAYKSDKPGIAPDCGMQLEPVYADGLDEASDSTGHASTPGGVNITLEQQQSIGVRVAPSRASRYSPPQAMKARPLAPETSRRVRSMTLPVSASPDGVGPRMTYP
ncbi:MAG TPA: heavy metal-binding domain-containing protein [Terriglobales bacterium]|jgi:Cu(I)/Ag(I) efflux system membrane fusion protein